MLEVKQPVMDEFQDSMKIFDEYRKIICHCLFFQTSFRRSTISDARTQIV